MRIGWYTHSANDTLNPNRLTTSLDFMRAYQICSPIVRYSTKLTAEPDLASEWNASDDLKTWRFKIRNDVEFHNGKSLTVQDCIYTLNRHRGEESDSIIKAWLDVIADMKADGDWLVIDLKAPNADFPMYLGDMHAVVVPDGFGAENLEDFDNLVGTGPFVLGQFPSRGRDAGEEEPELSPRRLSPRRRGGVVRHRRHRGARQRAAGRRHPHHGSGRSEVDSDHRGRAQHRDGELAVEPPPHLRDELGTVHPPTTATSARRCGC